MLLGPKASSGFPISFRGLGRVHKALNVCCPIWQPIPHVAIELEMELARKEVCTTDFEILMRKNNNVKHFISNNVLPDYMLK